MKKRVFFIATAVSLSLAATPANAGIQERLENHEERMENRQERAQENRENRQENRQERQENRQEKRSEIAENHGLRLEKRFGDYYTRLNTIIGKIQARIDASTTKNTAESQAKLEEAKTKLSEAKTLADSAVSQFKALDPAKYAEQKTAAQAARDTANKARQAFVDTLKLMNESVKLLKSAPAK